MSNSYEYDWMGKYMVMENDKFYIPERIMNMTQEEIRSEKESIYKNIKELKQFRELCEEVKRVMPITEAEIELLNKAAMYWGAYNQIKWERDIALSQLQELGISLGEKIDDLKRLIELNDQGLLVELPIKQGEQFWELNDNFTPPTIYPRWAHSLMHCLYCKERLGKTCFLTKEDGEKLLKKLEKEKDNDES